MNENFFKIFEKLERVSVVLLATLSFTLGLIIFLPDPTAERLAVSSFRKNYNAFLGPSFLILLAFLFARLTGEVIAYFRNRKVLRIRENQLQQLTAEEKGYLAEFVLNGRNTVKVGIDDGIMGGLVAKKICFMSSSIFDLVDGASFNLQPWAREKLEGDPSLLNGASGIPRTPRERRRRY